MAVPVAACQFEPAIGDVDANLERIRAFTRDLDDDIALAVFPELCTTGYDLAASVELAEGTSGPTVTTLTEFASETGTHLVVGLPERDGGLLYNATVVISPDGLDTIYRKRCLWGDEADVFDAGDAPVVAETPVGSVGLLCCYDLNFPEFALEYAGCGCDVLAVTAAWRTSFLGDWRLLTRARARDGPCYVVAANHTGEQRGREHAGHSLVAGPDGTVHAEVNAKPGYTTTRLSTDLLEREHERNPVRETRRIREWW